jgi:hypothetical protein
MPELWHCCVYLSLAKIKMHFPDVLGFPFQLATSITTLPVSQHGFGFSLITRINTGLSIEGLFRDLNHHILAYQSMALITQADWTCKKNGCVNPLDGISLQKDHLRWIESIPANWIIAQRWWILFLSFSEKQTSHTLLEVKSPYHML